MFEITSVRWDEVSFKITLCACAGFFSFALPRTRRISHFVVRTSTVRFYRAEIWKQCPTPHHRLSILLVDRPLFLLWNANPMRGNQWGQPKHRPPAWSVVPHPRTRYAYTDLGDHLSSSSWLWDRMYVLTFMQLGAPTPAYSQLQGDLSVPRMLQNQ